MVMAMLMCLLGLVQPVDAMGGGDVSDPPLSPSKCTHNITHGVVDGICPCDAALGVRSVCVCVCANRKHGVGDKERVREYT
jgi:hypothetical protein